MPIDNTNLNIKFLTKPKPNLTMKTNMKDETALHFKDYNNAILGSIVLQQKQV